MTSPRHLLIEQVIPQYRAWLTKVATGFLSPTHESLDDLIQEGYIAMWRACGSFDPDSGPADYWLKRSATRRMLTVLQRNHWTGQDQRFNGGHGGSQPEQPVLSFDVLSAALDNPFDVEDVLVTLRLDDAAWAYHEGEIMAALASLTERERRYVVARFWGDLTNPQLVPVMDMPNPANLWKTAKPKLREKLAHLVPA